MKKTLHLILIAAFLIFNNDVSYASFGKKSNPESSSTPSQTSSTVNSAVEEFKHLSKQEKKARFKEVKKELQNFKEAKKNGAAPETNTILLAILAILLPPLAVFLHQGEINSKFWIALLLTLILWLPGIIYALLVIFGNA